MPEARPPAEIGQPVGFRRAEVSGRGRSFLFFSSKHSVGTAVVVAIMLFAFSPSFPAIQYSSGRRSVVAERSASVMTQSLSPAEVR